MVTKLWKSRHKVNEEAVNEKSKKELKIVYNRRG